MQAVTGRDKVLKYEVFPGHVTSRSDGDRHYISASQLIHLYCVDPLECRVFNGCPGGRSGGRSGGSLISLFPRRDGEYPDLGMQED